MVLQIIFWFSLLILFHSYLGYALIAAAILKFRGSKKIAKKYATEFYPSVTLIIAAYNEIEILSSKINNTLSLDYYPGELSIVFVTDGSDDGSAELISAYSQIKLLHQPERKGKAAAINRAMQIISTEIVIFSDANSLLNKEALIEIVKHYYDGKVGGVAGEKKVAVSRNGKAVAAGEGFYWKYESWLKSVDSDFYSVVGAAGELFSIRSKLFRPLEEDVILDDFVMSLRICLQGYRVKYEPAAFAIESASASIVEEEKRKVRISAGGFQAMAMLGSLFNFFRHPSLSYLYVSHRVLRWTLCPLVLPVVLLTNILIAPLSIIYQAALVLQIIFYLIALAGSLVPMSGLLFVPYYFVFMNWSLVQGFFRFLFQKHNVLWEKSRRAD